MMENTPENKSRFYALHWGQKVMRCHTFNEFARPNVGVSGHMFVNINEVTVKGSWFLELTPLSQISDEDACHIAMLLVRWPDFASKLTQITVRQRIDGEHGDVKVVFEFRGSFQYTIRLVGNDWLGWIDSNGRCEWTLFNIQEVNDYLRSKGYALPYMGLSVEKLVEYGWVKLKEA